MLFDGTVSDENLYLLLAGKISHVANMMMKDKGIGLVDAVKEIYNSEVYKKLEDEKTKFWYLGPVALYEEL